MRPPYSLDGSAVPRQSRSYEYADDEKQPLISMLDLAPLTNAVSCARLHVTHVLREWGLQGISDSAGLLVSELVTNGVKASALMNDYPPVRLRLSALSDRVVIEVWDGSLEPPRPSELDGDFPELDQESGRGLFLVMAIGQRWGWYATSRPAGKVVWCELGMDESGRRGQSGL